MNANVSSDMNTDMNTDDPRDSRDSAPQNQSARDGSPQNSTPQNNDSRDSCQRDRDPQNSAPQSNDSRDSAARDHDPQDNPPALCSQPSSRPVLEPIFMRRPREIPVCGLASVNALFAQRPGAIKRLFFDAASSSRLGKMASHLAKNKKPYRMVAARELEKVSGTVHHGGAVAIIAAPELREPTLDEVAAWGKTREPVLVLDRVGNAHNLGALVRTAAFFGVKKIILADDQQQAMPGEAAYRVAEGGFEHVEIFRVWDLPGFCRALVESGYEVCGAAVASRETLDRAVREIGPARPVALVLGNEETGLNANIAAACTRFVTIPGAGNVESLNVSAAAAVLMWALWPARNGGAFAKDQAREGEKG
jgi:TrmH RNA methyltransferase